jgi:hypothetical protein
MLPLKSQYFQIMGFEWFHPRIGVSYYCNMIIPDTPDMVVKCPMRREISYTEY